MIQDRNEITRFRIYLSEKNLSEKKKKIKIIGKAFINNGQTRDLNWI